jgi:glycerate dehydrogenase
VDVEYCREKGIPVSNVPTYSTNAVAQLTFALIMEFTNKVSLHNASVKKGDWTNCSDFCYQIGTLTELNGKTLGIVGYGKIGRTVAKIAAAYGMKVLACTAHPEKYPNETDVKITTLDEVKRNSDFITLHCPLTPQTEKLVNAEKLAMMKQTAFLINTSRGPVVDEEALAAALNTGRIAGAAADTLSTEPPKADNPLLTAKNCFITPHLAWATAEAKGRLVDVLVNNIKAFAEGAPINVVNG